MRSQRLSEKVFFVLPFLLLALRNGQLIIIDELDAKLHPELLKYAIDMFCNLEINKHGAQLLFSSQDMIALSSNLFRQDEVWVSAKNTEHGSELYSLYEIRNEKGEKNKKYIFIQQTILNV